MAGELLQKVAGDCYPSDITIRWGKTWGDERVRVMTRAQGIANRHNHEFVTREHFLISLIEEDGAVELLINRGVDIASLSAGLGYHLTRGMNDLVYFPPIVALYSNKVLGIDERALFYVFRRGDPSGFTVPDTDEVVRIADLVRSLYAEYICYRPCFALERLREATDPLYREVFRKMHGE